MVYIYIYIYKLHDTLTCTTLSQVTTFDINGIITHMKINHLYLNRVQDISSIKVL